MSRFATSRVSIPPSDLLSPEARTSLTATGVPEADDPGDDYRTEAGLLAIRARAATSAEQVRAELEQAFPVRTHEDEIGGVRVDIVEPADGVAPENERRVLLNLHGGGMFMGWRTLSWQESIPIAAVGRIRVITIDYRMAPEHRFPAASEDVEEVYREIIERHDSSDVGIFGSSSGATLAAQATAWMINRGLPEPGAIGLLGQGAVASGATPGDSHFLSAIANGTPVPEGHGFVPGSALEACYLYNSNRPPRDPLVEPAYSLPTLARFPPTLVLNSLRDHTLSAALFTHTQLLKAGVPAELVVWEGLPHGYYVDHRLPESRDTYDVIVDFFRRRLGARRE
jgi:acetyl esterase/lipase